MYTPDSPWKNTPGLPPAPHGGPLHDPAKALPCDTDAEKGVLSCFLNWPHLLGDAQVSLPVSFFHHPANRLLYTMLHRMRAEERPIDSVSVRSYLQDVGLLGEVAAPARYPSC